ncbi:Excalibur calcium-binding domain-containing protein [Novosphingobium sp. CF614]|nr:Excalibur calcium-binding domain-containing protein [Novosphingobium sp. CF614]
MRAGLIAIALAIAPSAVMAKTACLSDAEIEQAFGDEVRSGAVYIDTSALQGRPLCSGLPLGEQIQRMHAKAFPEERRQAEEARAAVVAREEAAARAREDQAREEMAREHARQAALAAIVPAAQVAVEAAPTARAAPIRKARTHANPPRRKAAPSHFASCREARAAGAAPLRRGEPGYAPRLDRDGDGVACE